jgi:NhaD family Na+/H+ antiporter
MDLTTSWIGLVALLAFVLAYALVITEEFTHFRKSIPVIVAAGVIWSVIGFRYAQSGATHVTEEAVKEYLVEFSQLFLFLLVAMTYVNSMTERRVFDALRTRLTHRGYGYRQLFWITGTVAFFLSPLIDNLTTALVLCAVVLAVGKDNPKFIAVACINIVVAANAGGAFSPFGDITTLMVWQSGKLHTLQFLTLFIPAAVSFLVPATLMSLTLPAKSLQGRGRLIAVKPGGKTIVALFACTVVTAVCFHNFLHLPPFLGMMTGLGYLKIYGYFLKRQEVAAANNNTDSPNAGDIQAFDSFRQVARAEWDTLLFFFGVILSVGGLGFIGYLEHLSQAMYGDLGPLVANSLVGVLSAVVDNIPVMVAVLEMEPAMDATQWLLVTLTAGVGGSMLSIGSAAGVALMGQARGSYTFFSHLKWTPAIAAGYAASIWVHMLING